MDESVSNCVFVNDQITIMQMAALKRRITELQEAAQKAN